MIEDQERNVALFTFLHDVLLNVSHLTPQISLRTDEVQRNSWNSNNSLMYIPIHLLIRSIDMCQSGRDGFVFIFPNTYHTLALKNRLPQLPAGNLRSHTSSTIPGHQKPTTFELSLHQMTESMRLNKTCQPKQAGVWEDFSGHATWEPQVISLLRLSVTMQRCANACTYTHAHHSVHSHLAHAAMTSNGTRR